MIKKALFLLLALTPITTFSQVYYSCGCTIGTDPFFGIVITYASTGSCANPSPGAALEQLYIGGQLQDSGYVDIQEAANQCELNNEIEVLSGIMTPLLAAFGSSGSDIILINGESLPFSINWTYNYDEDSWAYTVVY